MKKDNTPSNDGNQGSSPGKTINFQQILDASQAKLRPDQQAYLNSLQNAVVRGDVQSQQLQAYRQISSFWKDSVKNGFLPYIYYTGKIGELENSEKNLTFAAQLLLENCRELDDQALKTWMAVQAREFFQVALKLDPGNDSTKIGLGATYIFAGSANDPQELMKGIQQILEVSRKDSNNMFAQFMLGLGGAVSGQFDKAAERLNRVVAHDPENLEAILKIAEIREQQGQKQEAIGWYEKAKPLIGNPDVVKEINKRINSLQ